MPTRNPDPPLSSLRTRYTLFALLVVGLVVAVSAFAYLGLRHTQDQAARNLLERNALSESIQGVRAGLVEAYKSLDLFLLEPSVDAHRAHFDAALASAIDHARHLHASGWVARHGQDDTTGAALARLKQLQGEIGELVDTRLDSARQYPSLAVGNRVMAPAVVDADNAFAIIFNEMNTEGTQTRQPDTYLAFIRAQRLWMQMLSNARLYLANRVGSFNESSLTVQAQGIATLYGVIQEIHKELERLDAEGKVGFEGSAALGDMRRAMAIWFGGFEQVRRIHQSDRWRMDAVIMKEKIAPSVDAINLHLLTIEQAFSQAFAQDAEAIAQAAARLAWGLWLVAGLAVAFVVLVLMTTNRLVLRPIAAVTRALKAEAMGKTGVDMPAARTLETRDLIEAFGEMHHQVKLRQAELEHRALHDALTALPNRTLLFERIEHDIQLARRYDTRLSLLMLDLDRFKEINDTLGHQVGDSLLVEVGNRLRGCLRETDTVARLGGDEFAILLPGVSSEDVMHAVDKLLDTFRQPVRLLDVELYVAASIGVAMYPEHGEHAHTLLQHADVAMYVAKRAQSGYALYDADKDEHSITRLAMLTDLRQAIEHDQFQLHYQPIVSLATGEVASVEALLRWHHPKHGQVPPELVVELAEKTGLINPLTHAVIDQALAQAARWRAQGLPLHLSVNLSMHNLHDGHLVDTLRTALQTHGIPGTALTLEMTESAMMSNPRLAMHVLNEIDALGIRLAVDDFGTGFSSLAYLKSLPVDILKIDKSFVFGLDEDRSDQAIVRATLSLGHSLGLEVVAEGIETQQVWELLRDMGCDDAQGYHISRPLSAGELEAWLKKRRMAGN
ncbi:MAG: putative bifunctional diguanylate cyclase/phosphodiesterase [Gammaproteobacteria bacterium]